MHLMLIGLDHHMYIKKLLVLGIIFLALPLVYGHVFAQQTIQSNQFVTKVGDPQGPPPNTSSPGSGVKTSAPPSPANLRQAIIDKFGIELNGFSDQELNWAWEKFWDISHTNFFNLVKGRIVNRTSGPGESSGVSGCSIEFSYYTDQTLFNVVLIHELGHVIQNCTPDTKSLDSEHSKVYANGANPLTGYGNAKNFSPNGVALSCFGYTAAGENYAEMITYYLNPNVKEMTVRQGTCDNNGVVPFSGLNHQDYFLLAKKILGTY